MLYKSYKNYIKKKKQVRLIFFIFAMAKIQRIGHDHQAPVWHVLVVVLLGNQAVRLSKNKLPHTQYTSEPTDFTDSEPPIK